ncbi:hypothetical protein BS78_03G092600 [Paspalum vaginatum]|nr:hypothetical protein BS78_03G092600 [Paspalum vaginatum]
MCCDEVCVLLRFSGGGDGCGTGVIPGGGCRSLLLFIGFFGDIISYGNGLGKPWMRYGLLSVSMEGVVVSLPPLVTVLLRPADPALLVFGGAVAPTSSQKGRDLLLRPVRSPRSFNDFNAAWFWIAARSGFKNYDGLSWLYLVG